ncbi:9193_t:CDS:1, partial [Paraglomus brasilianum]
MILAVIKVVVQSKEIAMVLEKVKAHTGDEQNERANQIAKEEGKVGASTRVKRVMTKNMVFQPVWNGLDIECSLREFIKQILTTAARA